jgi:hypothetical protein
MVTLGSPILSNRHLDSFEIQQLDWLSHQIDCGLTIFPSSIPLSWWILPTGKMQQKSPTKQTQVFPNYVPV